MIKKFRHHFNRIFTSSSKTAASPTVKTRSPVEKSSPKTSPEPQKTEPGTADKSSSHKIREDKRREHAFHHPHHAVKGKHQVNQTPEIPEIREVPKEDGKTRFLDLDLEPALLAGIQDLEFQYCTPIQTMAMPDTLAGKDIAGKAQTGTGKTAAFLLGAFNQLLRNPQHKRKPGTCRVLVLAPTRELAIQIHKDAENIGKYGGFRNLAVFGGMGHKQQQEALRYPIDVLVGTPGRLLDYIQSQHLILSHTEILVIDEADRMLDMGFIPDVRRIVSRLPVAGKRQTMFFSATLTKEVLRLVDRWLANPVMFEAEPEQIVTDLIDQCFYSVSVDRKLELLLGIIKHEDVSRMLVFVNRRDRSEQVQRKLRGCGVECSILSGDVPQNKRLQILEQFRGGKIKVIIATDVAARGIHVDDISHVINYDLPNEPEDYIHRIGRTGRAGETGRSISFVCEYGAYVIPELEKLLEREINSTQPPEKLFVEAKTIRQNVQTDARPSPRTNQRRSGRPPRRRR